MCTAAETVVTVILAVCSQVTHSTHDGHKLQLEPATSVPPSAVTCSDVIFPFRRSRCPKRCSADHNCWRFVRPKGPTPVGQILQRKAHDRQMLEHGTGSETPAPPLNSRLDSSVHRVEMVIDTHCSASSKNTRMFFFLFIYLRFREVTG